MDKVKLKFHILAVICIVIFCIAISPKELQNDTFYTIRIGEYITENGIRKFNWRSFFLAWFKLYFSTLVVWFGDL